MVAHISIRVAAAAVALVLLMLLVFLVAGGVGRKSYEHLTPIPNLVYPSSNTDFVSELRGDHPSWWRSDGGTYGLPPAADRPDFWAGDWTLHTYLARDPTAPLCSPTQSRAQRIAAWRHWGGPRGWTMSPYY